MRSDEWWGSDLGKSCRFKVSAELRAGEVKRALAVSDGLQGT